MSAPETVAWVGTWTLRVADEDHVVTSAVIASRYGIMRYDTKPMRSGALDIQSEFKEGAWKRDPSKTFDLSLWEHPWVGGLQKRCDTVRQLELQPSGGVFQDLDLDTVCSERSKAAVELWRHFCRLEGVTNPDPYDGAGGFQHGFDDLHDMISQGQVDHYVNDPTFGSF